MWKVSNQSFKLGASSAAVWIQKPGANLKQFELKLVMWTYLVWETECKAIMFPIILRALNAHLTIVDANLDRIISITYAISCGLFPG